ncbi:NUDIX hydrolase [candidate division TA06 bacterium]|uniref:NUDIX hydrolase n=1 Tax=candidate division TA06 bacterium TaxID=2250710 RepID=A0A660SQN7_UNCT6|nr:MAG: NUDIX hydrolase [candidate division TA06 bacterium]
MRKKGVYILKNYPIRISAKAIIISNDRLLTIKHEQNNEKYFTLPGGGQNHNEDLKSALIRECLEEVGAEIAIDDLVFVRDYIADNHEFAKDDPGFHQVELMFECSILNSSTLHPQSEPDKTQIGIEWISLDDIQNLPLYPKVLKEEIINLQNRCVKHIYLGDVN